MKSAVRKVTLSSLPDDLFMPVIKKVDIVSARILSRQEREQLNVQRGGADVLIETPSGRSMLITRNQLIENYRLLNGGKIKLSSWKNGVNYLIMKPANSNAFALMVPRKYAIVLDNNVSNSVGMPGVYVVCDSSEDGSIDKSSAHVVDRILFRKMYNMPQNDIIARFSHRGQLKKGNNIVRDINVNVRPSNVDGNNVNMHLSNIDSNNVKGEKSVAVKEGLNFSNNRVIKEEGDGRYFTAIGKLVNNDGKIVGFVVRDKKGNTRNVTKVEMLRLCENRLVDNIVAVYKEGTNTRYLRGNGIKIEDLPSYRV